MPRQRAILPLTFIVSACCFGPGVLPIAASPGAVTVSLAADCVCESEYDFGFWHPAWSPDGQLLAMGTGNAYPPTYTYWGSVFTTAVGGGSFDCGFSDHAPVAYPSWAPDSRRLVFSHGLGFLHVLDCESTDPPVKLPGGEGTHPAWSPDGMTIAFVHGGIWRMPASGGAPSRLTDGGDSPAWSPDGARIAYHVDGAIWTMDAAGGYRQRLTEGRDPAWSPDGDWIAFASDRAGDSDIWVIATTGGTAVRVTDSPQVETDPTWAPDQRSLAFTAAAQDGECSCVFIASDLPEDWTTTVTSWTWSGVKTLYR